MKIEHHFRSELKWRLGGKEFLRDYSRNHRIYFPGKQEILGSAAPRFMGNGDLISPEELYIASVSSCFMLTFLNLMYRNRQEVIAYHDEADGYLSRNEEGSYWMERIHLRPHISIRGSDEEEMRALSIRLVHESHSECFLIASIRTRVDVEPLFVYSI